MGVDVYLCMFTNRYLCKDTSIFVYDFASQYLHSNIFDDAI